MKIVLHKSKCISCGSCAAVCPDYFEMGEDNFSHLKGSQASDSGEEFLEIEKEKIGCTKEAAEVCPIQIIEIT